MLAGRWPIIVLLGAVLLMGVPSSGRPDQRDARLVALFEQLKTAGNRQTALAVEADIWRIWLESGREEIDALMAEGVSAMTGQHFEEAIDIFGQITARAPGFAEGWNKRATAYYLNEDYVASVQDIQTTLALEPRHFGAISGMGLIFLQRGDEVGALAAFEAVLAIHPHAPGARQRVEALRERLPRHGA